MTSLLFSILCLALAITLALASVVGGPGYAVRFSRERADVISLALGDFAGDEFSLMYWMKPSDSHQDVHSAVNYGAYDSHHIPSISSPDEFALLHHRDYVEAHRGPNTIVCDNTLCALHELEWFQVTYTWRSHDGLASVYINGDLVAAHNVSTGEPIIPNGVLVLGQEPHGFVSLYDEERALTGIIDEVVVMTRELTAQEVKDYADRGRPLDDDDLLLYWTFDDPTATEFVSDLSPHGRDGFIGFLDNRLDELSYATGRDPQPPTSPAFVVSTAPLVGHGPVVTALHAGEDSVEVVLLFAPDDAKIPVDRRDPNVSASFSTAEGQPTLADYWDSYAKVSVVMKIESLPQYGKLWDVGQQKVLEVGGVVSSGARVRYELDVMVYESTWAPLQEAAGSVLVVPDVFTYSADGVVATAHVVASRTVQTPPEKEYSCGISISVSLLWRLSSYLTQEALLSLETERSLGSIPVATCMLLVVQHFVLQEIDLPKCRRPAEQRAKQAVSHGKHAVVSSRHSCQPEAVSHGKQADMTIRQSRQLGSHVNQKQAVLSPCTPEK